MGFHSVKLALWGDQNKDRRVQGELSYTEGVLCWDLGVILDMEMDDMRFRERIPSISSELLKPCSTSMRWDFTKMRCTFQNRPKTAQNR